MSLFDERDLASITAPDYPNERLIVCRNPALANERARKREDLLEATERDLAKIEVAVRRRQRTLRGKAKIALKVGAVLDRHKMAKRFTLTITDDHFAFTRKTGAIANAEPAMERSALDGLYVIRTSVAKETLSDEGAIRAYKSLAQVEWPRRQDLAPMLYDDTDREAAEALRDRVVAKARISPAARTKKIKGKTEDGLPMRSLQSLLADLATLNKTVTPLNDNDELNLFARPTPIQDKAFNLLGIKPERTQQTTIADTQNCARSIPCAYFE